MGQTKMICAQIEMRQLAQRILMGERLTKPTGFATKAGCLPGQRVRHGSQREAHHRQRGCVLLQFPGDDLVQRVGDGVMIVEVDAAILQQTENGHPLLGQGLEIGFRTIAAQLNQICPENLQNFLYWL